MIVYQNVYELTKIIKNTLENQSELTFFKVSGEVSNYKHHSSNHRYFTLKDKQASINVVMFSMYAKDLTFEPKNGDHVTITGQISVYEPSGTYSVRANKMEKVGLGLLYEQFVKLKNDLEKLGYFDESLKKSIPKYPQAIGLVTSKTGAVFHDVFITLEKRYPLIPLYFYQAQVQGATASKSIADQINQANIDKLVDVLIVGRGGGSIEDLWAFNEMPTIEAILNSKIPIITAIGHETDTTISDYVADLRAATPTAAAVFASPNLSDLKAYNNELNHKISTQLIQYLNDKNTRLIHLSEQLNLLSPLNKLTRDREHLHQLNHLLHRNFQIYLVKLKSDVNILVGRLKSPLDKIKYYQDQTYLLKDRLKTHLSNHLIHKKQKLLMLNDQLYPLFEKQIFERSKILSNNIQNLKTLNPLAKIEAGFGLLRQNQKIVTSTIQIKKDDLLEIEIQDAYIKTKIVDIKEKTHGTS